MQTHRQSTVLRRDAQILAARISPPDTRRLLQSLYKWYRREARDLPWRRTADPYAIWLAEIMLQQTRVVQGIPYYEAFLKKFPSISALAQATLDEVLKSWEGLGYYARARNLHKAAQQIMENFGGTLPTKAQELQSLPGIGPYTAAAIASIAFKERIAVVDGNVQRVLTRWFDYDQNIDHTSTKQLLWHLAQELIPARIHPGLHNQAMMELGSQVCTYRKPGCLICPVRQWCLGFRNGRAEYLPRRGDSREIPHYDIAVAVISHKGSFLIGKRPPHALLGGLWEFPGGKIRPQETPEQALIREIKEELGITIEPLEHVATVHHAYSHFRVTLHVYRCLIKKGKPQPKYHTELRWAERSELNKYAFPKANLKFIPLL